MESTATSPPPAEETREGLFLDRLATATAYALSPPVLLPLLMWLLLGWVGASTSETFILVSGIALLMSILPLIYVVWMVRSARARSLNLENRRHRSQAMAIGLAGGLLYIGLIASVAQTSRDFVLATTLAYVATTGLLIAINNRWRISLHMASVAGFLAVVIFVAQAAAGPMQGAIRPWAAAGAAALCIPLVAWSRLHLQAHTAGQVVGGVVVGLALPYLILELLSAWSDFDIGG